MASLEISFDATRLDIDRVTQWLSTDAYWSKGRSAELVRRSFANSLGIGAYVEGVQVGVARLVTDSATFAWLCDVYVAPEARGRGVGKALMDAVSSWSAEVEPKWVVLATEDAHGLYARHGFASLDPERWMGLRVRQGER